MSFLTLNMSLLTFISSNNVSILELVKRLKKKYIYSAVFTTNFKNSTQ